MEDWKLRKFKKLCFSCEFHKNKEQMNELMSKIKPLVPLGYEAVMAGGWYPGSDPHEIRIVKR